MLKVLLVDDEPKILRALSASLEENYEVITATSVGKAKTIIGEVGAFDAVVSDELMAGEKGHELLNWVNKKTPTSNRVMLTGLPITEDLKAKVDNLENLAFITKPWNVSVLTKAIGSINAEIKPKKLRSKMYKNINKLIVFDNSKKYRELYTKLSERNFDEIIFYSNPQELIGGSLLQGTSQTVVLNIEEERVSDVGLVEIIKNKYPSVKIIVTIKPELAIMMSEFGAQLKHTQMLVKPFSLNRLEAFLK